ncbi:UNVERIFIED_CONTAM: hypothetical protein K2H54_057921 [Gekko kuhli]
MHRQYDDQGSCEPTGRHQIKVPVLGGKPSTKMSGKTYSQSKHGTPQVLGQPEDGLVEQGGPGPRGMEFEQRGVHPDCQAVWITSDRPDGNSDNQVQAQQTVGAMRNNNMN